LRDRFVSSYETDNLISAEQSAASLPKRLASSASGEIWSARGTEIPPAAR
jgi:hypothetical protein